MDKQNSNIYYAVILDWAYQGADEIDLLCITQDFSEAHDVLNKAMEKEKRDSWISKVSPEDIGGDDFEYTEVLTDTAWCFYETGAHTEKHTDITIFTYDKSKK